ncbi:MAG: MFS transporter [Anaerolineaceae bacterium]
MTDLTSVQVPTASRLTSGTKTAFGLASLGMAVIGGIYGAMLTKFYQDNLGLGHQLIGIAMLIYAVWNAINDPIFGEISDRTVSKLGRRIPYLRYTAPFFAATFIAVWFCPEKISEIGKFWWMLVTMLLYDTCYTILGLVHGTLLPELSESDKEHAKLSMFGAIFGLIGTLIGFVVPDLVRPSAANQSASLTPLRIAMVIVGVVFSGLIFYSSYHLKEHREYSLVDKPLPWWKAIKSTFTNKGFLIYVIASFMQTFMFAIAIGAIFYMSDYVTQSSVLPLLAAMFIPMALCVPLVSIVMKRITAATTWQIYLLIAGVGFVSLFFLPVNLLWLGMALAGIGYSGVQVVNYIVLGQVIDKDEIDTGVRREGSFLGANALITKPAQSLAVYLTALILASTAFVSMESNQGQIYLNQPQTALLGIRALVGLIPGIALIIAAIALFWFPYKAQKVDEIKTTILQMHAGKKTRLAEMEQEKLREDQIGFEP